MTFREAKSQLEGATTLLAAEAVLKEVKALKREGRITVAQQTELRNIYKQRFDKLRGDIRRARTVLILDGSAEGP